MDNYILLIIIILATIGILFRKRIKENFSFNSGLKKVLRDNTIYYNNVIPSEYKTYILDILKRIFNSISDYIPYEIIEIISNNDIIHVLFFANSKNNYSSKLFKARFKLTNEKLEIMDLSAKDDTITYGNEKLQPENDIHGINTFRIIYPDNLNKIDIDKIVGVLDDKMYKYTKLNYRVNPIIDQNTLRKNILPQKIPDYFNQDHNKLYSSPLYNTQLSDNKYIYHGNHFTPGMFKRHFESATMFSDAPQLIFSASRSGRRRKSN